MTDDISQATAAEYAVLGSALLSAPAGMNAVIQLGDADFQPGRTRWIAAAIRDMIRNNHTPDVITVAAELEARGELTRCGGSAELHKITTLSPIPTAADYYATIVRRHARARALTEIAQQLRKNIIAEPGAEHVDEVLQAHKTRLETIPGELVDETEDNTLTRLLGEHDTPEDWIIPGLIAREERIVMTAAEGVAKSTLMRQHAATIAAGLHPWTGQRVSGGHRVLHVDAENSRQQSRRGYRMIAHGIRNRLAAPGWADRITVHIRNAGLDLTGRDAGWLDQAAADWSPDIIVIGPAYKIMRGDPKDDGDVMALLNVLDDVRVRHRCALLIEAHAPKGSSGEDRDMRPFGSSVWLRWPEIGFGWKRDLDPSLVQDRRPRFLEAVDWRGAREDRDWPDRICWGHEQYPRSEMPWVPTNPDYEPSILLDYEIPDDETSGY